jgi:hypothetical protein
MFVCQLDSQQTQTPGKSKKRPLCRLIWFWIADQESQAWCAGDFPIVAEASSGFVGSVLTADDKMVNLVGGNINQAVSLATLLRAP